MVVKAEYIGFPGNLLPIHALTRGRSLKLQGGVCFMLSVHALTVFADWAQPVRDRIGNAVMLHGVL